MIDKISKINVQYTLKDAVVVHRPSPESQKMIQEFMVSNGIKVMSEEESKNLSDMMVEKIEELKKLHNKK